MKKLTKFILGDIQEIISNNLSKNSKPLISEALLYDIVFYIEGKLSTPENIEKGTKISKQDWAANFSVGYDVILRHIEWLISYSIIWRSTLMFKPAEIREDNESFKNEVRKYNLHYSIKINNYNRFVYTTYKDFNMLKDLTPVLNNITESNVYVNLMKTDIDWEKAIETIFKSEMRYNGKRQQSFSTYQLAFKKFKLHQKNSDRRIFHTVTSLSSKLHKHLYIDSKRVSEVDAKQSQLVLLSLLTSGVDSLFYNDVHNKYMYDEIISFWQNKIEKDIMLTNKTVKFKYFDANDKITKYIEHYKLNKDIIKPLVYAALFSGFNTKNYNPVVEYFEIRYPKLVEYVRNNYSKENSLALELQKLEASIWLKTFNNLCDKGIACLPKHDAILFKSEDEYKVIQELIEQYNANGLTINKDNIDNYLDIDLNTESLNKPIEPPKVVLIDDFETESKNMQKEIKMKQGKTNLTQYFFTRKDGSTWVGIPSDFAHEFNIDKKNVNKFIKGKLNSLNKKEWVKVIQVS